MRNNRKNQRGYTLIELMIVMAIVGILATVVLYLSVGAANFWCTDNGVERELKAAHPEVASVISINRGVWADTKILVKTKDGETQTWCLDSNILFNYDFSNCSN